MSVTTLLVSIGATPSWPANAASAAALLPFAPTVEALPSLEAPVHRHRLMQLPAKLGRHHGAHVGVGEHRGVARHVFELIRSPAAREGAHREPGIVGHQPGTHAHAQYEKRSNHEIPGPGRHVKVLNCLYGARLPIVQAR